MFFHMINYKATSTSGLITRLFHISFVDFAKAHHSSMEMMWSAYDFIQRYWDLYRTQIRSLLVLMWFRIFVDFVPLGWRLPHRNFIDDIVTLWISLLIFQPLMCPLFILLTPLFPRNRTYRMREFSAENRLVFLISSGILVLYTIWNGIKGNIHFEDKYLNMIIFFICFPVETLPNFIFPPTSGQRSAFGWLFTSFDALPYCPSMLDIVDGLEMAISKLNSTNPTWKQMMILCAVIMFLIPTLLEMYYLRFTDSIISERTLRRAQIICSCIFLIFRLCFASNEHEKLFSSCKTVIRVYCFYRALSDIQANVIDTAHV